MVNNITRRLKKKRKRKKRLFNKKLTKKRINNKKQTKRRISKRIKKRSKKKNKGRGQSISLPKQKIWDDSEYEVVEDLSNKMVMDTKVKTNPIIMVNNLEEELDDDSIFINHNPDYIYKYMTPIAKIYVERLQFIPNNLSEASRAEKRKYKSMLLKLIKNEGLIGESQPFCMSNRTSSSDGSVGGKKKKIYNGGGFIATVAGSVSSSAAEVALAADSLRQVATGNHINTGGTNKVSSNDDVKDNTGEVEENDTGDVEENDTGDVEENDVH